MNSVTHLDNLFVKIDTSVTAYRYDTLWYGYDTRRYIMKSAYQWMYEFRAFWCPGQKGMDILPAGYRKFVWYHVVAGGDTVSQARQRGRTMGINGVRGFLPDNWFDSYAMVQKAMVLDGSFALRCIDATADEAAILVVEAHRIVDAAFWATQRARQAKALPRKSDRASVVVRYRIAPRPSGYRPNPLLD